MSMGKWVGGWVAMFVLAALACAFVSFAYAEQASMIPVSGSAYTYAYATLGELFAWIIGWDLLLEYAVGASAVASGWSGCWVGLAPLPSSRTTFTAGGRSVGG